MIKRITFLLLIASGLQAQQFAFEYWHPGKIVIEGGDTLQGQIKYTMENDLLQIQVNRQMETLSARKVLFFEIMDKTVQRYRQFYSLPYATSGQYKAPVFFELLTEGKLTLLCREALEYRTYSSFYFYGSNTRLVLVYKYFLLDEKGDITEFKGKKNEWIQLMDDHAEEVQRYSKVNRLDFDDKYELIKIVRFYNSLFF